MKRSFKSSQEAFKSHAKNQYNENVTKKRKKGRSFIQGNLSEYVSKSSLPMVCTVGEI